jgi:predicted transcriptional regulator
MAAPTPTIEEMLQQMLNFQQTTMDAVQELMNGFSTSITRFDELAERVQALELALSRPS